ncbi:MAG: AAA family ATPase [Chitinophagales bacterium]|nr:AAA family ATPase [Chitinophagales bacterium]
MNLNNIKSFTVLGLFGTNDVTIPFKDGIKILIGENGLGKTQVLNLFYYTLERNFFRLGEFNFDKILVELEKETIQISKSQIDELVKEAFSDPSIQDFIEEFGYSHFEFLKNKYIQLKGNRFQFERELDTNYSYSKYRKYPLHRIFRIFDKLESNNSNIFNHQIKNCESIINDAIRGYDIMYFPTYRRVEEDLHSLGYDEDNINFDEDKTLIQFGMDDVQRRFNFIQNTIDKQLKEGLAQFTKDILNVVIEDEQPRNNLFDKINEEDIDIILSRVGNLLPQTQKDSVKNIIIKKEYKNQLHGYLLQKLIDIYEKQKELDNSVKVFRDVCNKYLINKEVFYDESAIKIFIKSHFTGDEIKLSKLSSGEKQIVSIFSKVYLSEKDKRFIVLFDEPELSLSMIWQKQLLPDILDSKKCDFLLAVTHSPFIFDNELDQYAVGLSEYVSGSAETFKHGELN